MTHDASIKNMVGAVADDFISWTRTPNQAVMRGCRSPYPIDNSSVYVRLMPANPRYSPLFQGQTGATHDLRRAAAALKETGDE